MCVRLTASSGARGDLTASWPDRYLCASNRPDRDPGRINHCDGTASTRIEISSRWLARSLPTSLVPLNRASQHGASDDRTDHRLDPGGPAPRYERGLAKPLPKRQLFDLLLPAQNVQAVDQQPNANQTEQQPKGKPIALAPSSMRPARDHNVALDDARLEPP
jgi:hypothetical protein